MTDIEGIGGRLGVALERIEAGVARIRSGAHSSGDAETRAAEAEARAEALQEALDSERGAHEQLAERLRQATRRHEAQARRLQAEADEARARVEESMAQLARQRDIAERLIETSRELREGAGGEVPVDAALRAELDALRAAREADRGEVDAILHELAPLLEREEAV